MDPAGRRRRAMNARGLHTFEYVDRLALPFTRMALGASFLSGVADRFGIWPKRYEGYGDWAGFVRYTAKVNSFAPSALAPVLAYAATAAELILGIGLIVGYRLRAVSLASAALLLLFASAMAVSFGLKSPLDYSVFSAAGAALLVARARARESADQNPRTSAVAKYKIASDARRTPRPSHDAARRVRIAAASCASVATSTTTTRASL
jgi:uncharacterized membrane protein YphA (DoxX/SURF4 family)